MGILNQRLSLVESKGYPRASKTLQATTWRREHTIAQVACLLHDYFSAAYGVPESGMLATESDELRLIRPRGKGEQSVTMFLWDGL